MSSGPYTAENYVRQADHTPNTDQPEDETYILTLRTDHEHHKTMTALRNQYFPPRLNKLSAHMALFRALPGSHLPKIKSDILAQCSRQQPFKIHTTGLSRLSHGVSINVMAPKAENIHKEFKSKWQGFLSKQDGGFKAHYTIQNKVEKGVSEKTLKKVEREFEGSEGWGEGLTLWRYDRGFWRHEEDYMFQRNGVATGE